LRQTNLELGRVDIDRGWTWSTIRAQKVGRLEGGEGGEDYFVREEYPQKKGFYREWGRKVLVTPKFRRR